MRNHSRDYADELELADRLALTLQDRRLESLVLLEMLRSSVSDPDPLPAGADPADAGAGDHSGTADESTFTHALKIASFLAQEFGFRTLDQKIYLSELAVELAQRIAEDLPDLSESRREAPTA
jgi:hypothetical protein